MEDLESLPDLLSIYYARLFPFVDFYGWLNYGGGTTFFHLREFSFTVKDSVYIRFQAFKDIMEFRKEVKRLLPNKIDIGAVYNQCPTQHGRGTKFVPVQRELVFDIDMTDYDEVRTCCVGATICKKCWKFMALACKILDVALQEDFGFKHILWVFSGRRGIHCWVCDEEARTMSDQERGALAEYLQVLRGGEFMKRKVNLPGNKIHHSIRRALNLIAPLFVSMCIEEQNVLGSQNGMETFLALITHEEDKQKLRSLFEQCGSSLARWNSFVKWINDEREKAVDQNLHRHRIEEIMLQYCYPRLDINVTKPMNHLLKAPFSVHPKTGKICVPFATTSVPFAASSADKFDPDKVPTVARVIRELNEFNVTGNTTTSEPNPRGRRACKRTSLARPMLIFRVFARDLRDSRRKLKRKSSEVALEF